MLYKSFDSLKEAHGQDYFKSRVDDEIIRNLNPKLELREYQQEALGRFDFYMSGEYQKKKYPIQLLFNMATGSGKTLIMAANILQLYKHDYRNFVFFVNSRNTIKKTRDNFLNYLSNKYLFANKIKFKEKEIKVNEVDNFEVTSEEDINIVFTTIQGLHDKLNNPQENNITYEDFENNKVVFISDEAHHINALTKLKYINTNQQAFFDSEETITDLSGLSKEERKEIRSWEGTVERILNTNKNNVLLEFTATIELEHPAVKEKYEDKIIFQYNLTQFRIDGYSKEINVLQADLSPMQRAIQALLVSQYRRKVAENNRIRLKPVVLLKSKTIKESVTFKEEFDKKIASLSAGDINEIKKGQNNIVKDAFEYFDQQGVTAKQLAKELRVELAPERCILLDSKNISEEKQYLLNNLEDRNNEIRALFAVDMLNEGWDVLNLFDIVRLYETRDAKANKPGSTTNKEAQLIGRGARYFPFTYNNKDKYKRKFDYDLEHELRPLEELHYHSMQDHRYINEIKTVLQKEGALEKKYKEVPLTIKNEFKGTEFWKQGVVFANDWVKNRCEDIFSFNDIDINKHHTYTIKTGTINEEGLLNNNFKPCSQTERVQSHVQYKLINLGKHVIRNAMDFLDFYQFGVLNKYFPHIESQTSFILSNEYLGGITVNVDGPREVVENLSQQQKFDIAFSILRKVAQEIQSKTAEYIGTVQFKPYSLKNIIKNKMMKFTNDTERIQNSKYLNMEAKKWYAQNALYGTSEEQEFISFFESAINNLQEKYEDVAILRNEHFFTIYDFNKGRAFEPDFILMLKEKKSKNITTHQVFIEPKGNQFKDANGNFQDSKEGWKQKFLLEIRDKAEIVYETKHKKIRLIGLPFYNKDMESNFKKIFNDQFLS